MIIFELPWSTFHYMWNLTQGWRTEGSETTTSESSYCSDTVSHSNLESPEELDTSHVVLDKRAEVNSVPDDVAPVAQSDVVKRTTFELVVSRVAYALHMRRFTEYLIRYDPPSMCSLRSRLLTPHIVPIGTRMHFCTNSLFLSPNISVSLGSQEQRGATCC